MKGIAHFSIGIAAVSFLPGVMERALNNHAYDLLLAGVFALLPDTLDFKFARFFEREDIVIEPDENNLDAKQIADKVAAAIELANQSGKEVRVRFHTVQLAPDRWRQYFISYDTTRNEVEVKIGPIVNTSQQPFGGTIPPHEKAYARAKVSCGLIYKYDEPTQVDILSGPTVGFKPRKGGKVEALFIPWHRSWSHSFTLGIFLAIPLWLIFGWYWGLLALVAFWSHIISDFTGVMGSNLLWPFTKERTPGLALFHSSQALPNFFSVWISGLAIVYNANRVAVEPAFTMGPLKYFAIWVGIPALLTAIYVIFFSRKLEMGHLEQEEQELMEEFADGGEMGGYGR